VGSIEVIAAFGYFASSAGWPHVRYDLLNFYDDCHSAFRPGVFDVGGEEFPGSQGSSADSADRASVPLQLPYFFAALRDLRVFPVFTEAFADVAMAKCSNFLPDLSAAMSHRRFSPRPAHVSLGFSGLLKAAD
jgi:hypothetical protein